MLILQTFLRRKLTNQRHFIKFPVTDNIIEFKLLQAENSENDIKDKSSLFNINKTKMNLVGE